MNELRTESGGLFEVVGSQNGEKYRLIPENGGLELIDEEGVIRIANRLESEDFASECSK